MPAKHSANQRGGRLVNHWGAFLILIFKHIKLLHLKHVISPKIPVNDQSVTDFNIVGNYRDLAKCHGYGRYIRVKILEGWGNIWLDVFPHVGFCFYRTQVSLGSGLWVRCLYVKNFGWNFADVTLADNDTNSILADYANRAICGWWLSFRYFLENIFGLIFKHRLCY